MINVKPVPAIALLIIFSLLAWIAFGGGCKDKAEAVEPTQFEERINWDEDAVGITFIDCNFVTTEPNNTIAWTRTIWLSIEIEDEPTFDDVENRLYLYKGDDFYIVIAKNDPTEPELKPESTSDCAVVGAHDCV